jgi:hypothetical protein
MAKRTAFICCILLVAFPTLQADLRDEQSPEYYFTRLVYSNGRFGGYGKGWATDTPAADLKFMWGVQRLTGMRVYSDLHYMRIMDPDLFKYPYVYAVEVGQMQLSAPEAERLREYLLRGGFLHADDFWGLYEWRNFQLQMEKVFPDRPIELVPLSHEIFHTFYDVNEVMQIPNVANGCSGRRTWEDPSDIVPRILGISDDNGRLMVVITYNSDLGDAWEWMDQPCYPAKMTGQAYRMGINFILYAITH